MFLTYVIYLQQGRALTMEKSCPYSPQGTGQTSEKFKTSTKNAISLLSLIKYRITLLEKGLR